MTNEVVETAAAVAAGVTDRVTDSVGTQVAEGRELVNQIITWFAERGVSFAVNVVVAAVMLVLGALAIRLIGAAVRRAMSRGGESRKLLTNFVASVVTKTCWAVLAIMILGRLGVNVAPLVAGLGVTGFILGFAFQESLGNLASGMMIALNEPFRVGDFVSAAGLDGVVQEVNMMATVLATADNKRIVVPNKSIWGGPIVNFSALATRRVDLQVGIAYGADVEKAIAVISETLSRVPGVLADPAASVGVASLDASQVTINVRPWCKGADYWAVYGETLKSVKADLAKAGVAIPFPQVEVHMAKD